MKAMLKCWFYGSRLELLKNKDGKFIFGLCSTCSLALSIASINASVFSKTQKIWWFGMAVSIIFCAITILIFFLAPMFQIWRFKKHFGFVPATTTLGVAAQQREVDRVLEKKAAALQDLYKNQDELGTALKILANPSLDPSFCTLLSVVNYEDELRNVKPEIAKAKPHFYAIRDLAKSPLLPVPFAVKESYKDYLTALPQRTQANPLDATLHPEDMRPEALAGSGT